VLDFFADMKIAGPHKKGPCIELYQDTDPEPTARGPAIVAAQEFALASQ
jgi:hypothetical protein